MAESALERKAATASVVRTVTGPPLGCLPLLILRTAPGGMCLRVVNAGLEQLPGLHSGMRPAFDAVGKGEMLWVRECYPEAVSALLSNPCHGAKMAMLRPRCAIVIVKQVGFSYG